MSAVARPRPRLRRLPFAAGATAVATLAFAMAAGQEGPEVPTFVLAAAAVLLLGAAAWQRGSEVLRSGLAAQAFVAGLALAVVIAAWWLLAIVSAPGIAVGILISTVGAAMSVIPLVRPDSAWSRTRGTPWQTIVGGPTGRAQASLALRVWGPQLGGLFLVLVGLRVAYEANVGISVGVDPGLLALPLLVLILAAVGVVIWSAWKSARSGGAAGSSVRHGDPVARDEQVIAAHLHDSVLQTLSLIQRSADDPARVSQLARQQERSLRAWLAGRDDTAGTTLGAAVRLVAQEVEDEQPGAVIEVVAVGNAPLDREADAMVRAAREALRNAVRHAGSPVRVFLEVEDGARELFVRDTGPGFDLTAVADERRGVRDAIIGRMEHVGGTATIDSGAAGTEIALRLPPPPERPPRR